MPALDKTRLRRSLRALRAIPVGAGDEAIVAQESLDFLAMLAGIKPVYMLGRGYDNPAWIDGVRAATERDRVHVVEGPYWENAATMRGLSAWYCNHVGSSLVGRRAYYICKSRATLTAVEAACATAAPTVAEEARLLGFPTCCVAGHHRRARAFHEVTLAMLARRTGGDEAAMEGLLASGVSVAPEGESEKTQLDQAFALALAPFTSLNMCASCARTVTSPAMRLAKRYGDLAAAVDRGYFGALAA